MRTRTHTPRVIDISTCLNYFESIYSYTCFGSRANHILRRFAIGTTISLQMLWQFDHQVARTLSGMSRQPAWRITEVYQKRPRKYSRSHGALSPPCVCTDTDLHVQDCVGANEKPFEDVAKRDRPDKAYQQRPDKAYRV